MFVLSGVLAAKVCVDEHARCFHWAQAGECVALPQFMHDVCAASCRRCRGSITPTDPCIAEAAAELAPGAIQATFDRATALSEYTPSLPSAEPPVVVLDLSLIHI